MVGDKVVTSVAKNIRSSECSSFRISATQNIRSSEDPYLNISVAQNIRFSEIRRSEYP
jgi:hypothetical protein